MTFLAPLAALGLLVPLAIYLVHWFFGSRRRVRVSAVFLWADLPHAATGRSRRRWPPLTALLLLQLLAALLAVAALSRPATFSEPPRHVALILDASGSMQATDVAPRRFEAARARGLERLNALGPTDLATVVRAGREATLLASGSPDSARAALSAAQPGSAGSAIREALALASSRVGATPERRGAIVLLTDAAWPAPDPIGPVAAPVEVAAVGGGSDNQAITSLSVRMDPSGRGQTAFVELANAADHAARIAMRLTADGAVLDERQVDIAAKSRTGVSIPLPVDARHIAVRLIGQDSLGLDDHLETTAPGGPTREVAVLGRASDGLLRALEAVPGLHVRPSQAPGSDIPSDVTVLAGILPAQLPSGPLLLVDPPASSGRLLGVGLGSGDRLQAAHPLLQGLDLAALRGQAPAIGSVPGWMQVVLGTPDGPLIGEGRLEGRPAVAFTFDPAASGLEKSLAFPLLISNATAYLLVQAEATVAPSPREAFDPAESDIAPRPVASLAQAFHSGAPGLTGYGGDSGAALESNVIERWQWLAAGALLLLGAEWLVFARHG